MDGTMQVEQQGAGHEKYQARELLNPISDRDELVRRYKTQGTSSEWASRYEVELPGWPNKYVTGRVSR